MGKNKAYCYNCNKELDINSIYMSFAEQEEPDYANGKLIRRESEIKHFCKECYLEQSNPEVYMMQKRLKETEGKLKRLEKVFHGLGYDDERCEGLYETWYGNDRA